MPSEREIEAAAMALAKLNTAPPNRPDYKLWIVPALRALEAAEKIRYEAGQHEIR